MYNSAADDLIEKNGRMMESFDVFRQVYGLSKSYFTYVGLFNNFAYIIIVFVREVYISILWRFIKHVCYSAGLSRDVLKGQCHEIFDFRFFSWISFYQAPEYTIRVVSNFFENSRIFAAQGVLPTTSVNDTGGKWKKSSIRKVLIIFFDTFG